MLFVCTQTVTSVRHPSARHARHTSNYAYIYIQAFDTSFKPSFAKGSSKPYAAKCTITMQSNLIFRLHYMHVEMAHISICVPHSHTRARACSSSAAQRIALLFGSYLHRLPLQTASKTAASCLMARERNIFFLLNSYLFGHSGPFLVAGYFNRKWETGREHASTNSFSKLETEILERSQCQ